MREAIEKALKMRHGNDVFNKLKNSTVGIAGLGGLGSNIAISLSRLGVGKLVIVDHDAVELSNINRQQYFLEDVGVLKTQAICDKILKINPYIDVQSHNKYLEPDDILPIFESVDVLIEAFDSPKSKAMITNKWLTSGINKPLIGASGMAGYHCSNTVKTIKKFHQYYICGDQVSEGHNANGLYAPRVAICANHQANLALRLLVGEEINE